METTKDNYRLTAAVWEITMNCNMRCKHCGSSCTGPLPDELTTGEALNLCDDLAKLGLNRITLSGGEPFTRPDWHLIVERLSKNKVLTNILSNGWFITEEIAQKAKDAGVVNIGISLDGLEPTHDYIRKKGSYQQIMRALEIFDKLKIPAGIVTCIHGKNYNELPKMKEMLIEKKVRDWQLQAAVPMGNLMEHLDWILEAEYLDPIIDFAHDTMKEGKINAYLADDIGYFNLNEIEVKKNSTKSQFYSGIWNGCPAGKSIIGVRCNGDIIGCLSIRDDSYIEGNIRQIPLEVLWTRPGAFSWNRDLKKCNLSGFCKKCQFANYCLGGCSGAKILRYKEISDNKFCSYRFAVESHLGDVNSISDVNRLTAKGRELIAAEDYQLAELYISRALELQPKNTELLNLLGFAHYNLENYPECESCNLEVLKIEPNNVYSKKGLGICLSKVGRVEEGISLLREAIAGTDENFMDPYHDLAVVLADNGRCPEAVKVLDEGMKRSQAFKNQEQEFYSQLKAAMNPNPSL